MRRDALEAVKPVFQAADVAVDVLDVIAAICLFTLAGVERDVQEACVICKHGVSRSAIADQQRILGDDRFQNAHKRRPFKIGQHVTGCLAVAVPHDLRALHRLANERLVGFDDTGHHFRLGVLGRFQKAMTPTERRIERDAAARGRLPEAEAVGQSLSVGKPRIAAMELRQRRAGQCVKRLRAVLTAIALEARLRTPAANLA